MTMLSKSGIEYLLRPFLFTTRCNRYHATLATTPFVFLALSLLSLSRNILGWYLWDLFRFTTLSMLCLNAVFPLLHKSVQPIGRVG